MRNLKRALSLALSTVMLMGMMVVGTGASYVDVSSEDNQEAVDVMQAVNIMTGVTADEFDPDGGVTRGQMAVIMTKVLDLNTGNYSVSAMPFTDVPDWAKSYVAAIYAEGVTGGISDTLYGTDDPVTAAQAALMLMKALGYFQYPGDLADGWLLATIRQAGRIDLFDGIDAGAEEPLTRSEVAQLVLNTLEATMVEPTGSQGVQIGDVTVGSTIKYEEITKTGTKYNAIDDANDGNGKNFVQLGEELFDGDLEKTVDSADVFNRPGTKWEYNNKAIGTYAGEAELVYTVSVKSKNIYSDLGLSETDVAAVYVDGDPQGTFSIAKNSSTTLTGTGKGVQTEVFVDDDDNITIVMTNVYVGEVSSVNEDADEPYSVITGITGNGGQYETTAYAEDDIVLYTYADGEIQSVALAEVVSGAEVTSYTTKSGKYTALKADGTDYDMAAGYALDSELSGSVARETSYDLYLDANGYVIYVGYYEAASNNYAYVLKAEKLSGDFSGDTDKFYTAKLLLADGTVVTKATDEETTDPTGQWVTYTVDDDDVYSLTAKSTVSKVGSNNLCNIKLTNGTAEFSAQTSSGSGNKTVTYYANNSTVFVVYDVEEDEYTSYTGINNVPSIKVGTNYAPVVTVAINANDSDIARYVYIELTDSDNVSGATSDVIYIVASSKSDLISDELGEYYEYNALVNGEITTLKVRDDVTVTGDQVIKGVTTNNKGLVTALGGSVSGLQTQATGTNRVSGGTVGIGGKYYTYADDVAVYRIEDDELVESTINAVRNDTNDTVLYVLDDGVVTDLFITEVDGANQAGQLQSEVSTVIAEFEPASGSGLESVSVSGSTITLEASKDINNSGIVDELGTELATLVGQVKSVKISGLNSGNAYNDVMTAAAALKKDINDNHIPNAEDIAKDTVDEGSVKYTVTLTMDDDSTIVYNVEVNWSVVGTKTGA